eukprot:CAMPEP_0170540858 /NCGR_PEP_ID=MMETSP0211-20121228/778_1 /TAXON_ID=311385 /ORGANISM="Pseudokeronopsis sp., Strain OXSARD2" /LENGTH=178 /DNA_ID=CAMNT_0010843407 /DNA_START=895 /DNA_END=1431 /DNA_ORIENTATION=+
MILHRDLKPDNILLDSEENLKIGDFGLSKKSNFLQRRKSNNIVSLWYRAPEIILGSESYFNGVDMWSVGCIFGEFLIGRPMFACSNESKVMDKVFYLLGTPNLQYNPDYMKLRKFNDLEFGYYHGAPSMSEAFPKEKDLDALDLLGRLLTLNASDRISAREALYHSYFSPLRREELEF